MIKYPAWGTPASGNNFQWPSKEDIDAMDDIDFHLKSLSFKSANDGMNTGICCVTVTLSNGETSGELAVEGANPRTSGVIHFPSKKKDDRIRKVQSYCDSEGVYNIFFKDEMGNVISKYDPKNYGEIAMIKNEIEPHHEIIGIYGTQPNMSSNIFSSLGLVAISRFGN